MSTETTNKKIKIDNGTTFGRTYTDKAVDELLKNVGGGGDVWLNISPYVNGETMTISQEGFDLVWNSFYTETASPINKYAGIYIDESQKLFFDKAILSDIGGKQGLGFIYKVHIDDVEGYIFLNIYEDKSIEFDSKMFDRNLTLPQTAPIFQLIPSITTSNEQQNLTIGNGLTIENGVLKATGGGSKVWYELPSLFFLENITQKQFDEIKNLVLQNQLAGINCAGFYCPLIFYNDGRNISFFYP